MSKLSVLLILLAIYVSGKAHDYPRLTPDTLRVAIGENIFVLNKEVTNVLSPDPTDSYSGRIVTTVVDPRVNKLMVISTINGNYYFLLKATPGAVGLHDLRSGDYTSFIPVIDLEKQYDKDFNASVRYNSLEISKSLSNIQKLNSHSPKSNIAVKKEIKTSLILNKTYEDVQLKYYEYLLVNNSNKDYVVSMIKVFKDNKQVYPVERVYPAVISSQSTGRLLIVLKKDIAENISISIGSEYYGNLIKTNML